MKAFSGSNLMSKGGAASGGRGRGRPVFARKQAGAPQRGRKQQSKLPSLEGGGGELRRRCCHCFSRAIFALRSRALLLLTISLFPRFSGAVRGKGAAQYSLDDDDGYSYDPRDAEDDRFEQVRESADRLTAHGQLSSATQLYAATAALLRLTSSKQEQEKAAGRRWEAQTGLKSQSDGLEMYLKQPQSQSQGQMPKQSKRQQREFPALGRLACGAPACGTYGCLY